MSSGPEAKRQTVRGRKIKKTYITEFEQDAAKIRILFFVISN